MATLIQIMDWVNMPFIKPTLQRLKSIFAREMACFEVVPFFLGRFCANSSNLFHLWLSFYLYRNMATAHFCEEDLILVDLIAQINDTKWRFLRHFRCFQTIFSWTDHFLRPGQLSNNYTLPLPLIPDSFKKKMWLRHHEKFITCVILINVDCNLLADIKHIPHQKSHYPAFNMK